MSVAHGSTMESPLLSSRVDGVITGYPFTRSQRVVSVALKVKVLLSPQLGTHTRYFSKVDAALYHSGSWCALTPTSNDGDQAQDGGQRQGRRSRAADKRARAAGRLPTGRRGMQPARSLCHRAQEREGTEPHVYVRPKPGGQKRTFAPYGADVASVGPVKAQHATCPRSRGLSSPVRALHPWCSRYDHSFGEETTQVLDGLGFMYVCGARGLAGVDPYGIPTLWRSYAARACACSHGWS